MQLDASDKNGLTPLHYASAQEGVSVKEFLKARANMEVLDHGNTSSKIFSFLFLFGFIFISVLFLFYLFCLFFSQEALHQSSMRQIRRICRR